MRAKEFIVEYKQQRTEEFGGLEFKITPLDAAHSEHAGFVVTALDPTWGKELGYVVFAELDDGELDPRDLSVDDRYQGQGIAKTMYDYVKSLGYTINRSSDQTPAGKGFWDKHRGEEANVWEQELTEGWKERIAAGALGAGLALGGQQVYNQYNQPQQPQPQIQQQIQQPRPVQAQASPKDILITAAKAAGMSGNELAQFLAQTAHETMNFTRMREVGTPEYFAKKYETKRKAKILGNKVKGDGERYKGRGFIQLTGRDNYKRAGQALGIPLEAQPELAADPNTAAKIALWFWNKRVAPKVADFSNTKAVTKKINPGLKHQQRRQQQFAKYQVAQNETA